MVQAAAGFYTYFYILNDYGVRPGTLFFLSQEDGYFPNKDDVYNPDNPIGHWGNTRHGDKDYEDTLAWDRTKHGEVDIRLFYTDLKPHDWVKCRWDP